MENLQNRNMQINFFFYPKILFNPLSLYSGTPFSWIYKVTFMFWVSIIFSARIVFISDLSFATECNGNNDRVKKKIFYNKIRNTLKGIRFWTCFRFILKRKAMNWNLLQNYTYNQTLVYYEISHSKLLQLKKEIQIIINGAT